jgi:integrase
VFTGPEGQPLGRNKFRPIWVAARAAAGISGLYFHDLPGSGPTWAAEAGATVREVMERLGHTTATIALSYRHATQERDRAIADKLGALMRTASSDTGEGGATLVSIDR